MSVAVGIAHPCRAPGSPVVSSTATKIRAGTAMPPIAASTGTPACFGLRRLPATNSCLSSTPTTKKKIASRPSAAHVDSVRSRWSGADGPTTVLDSVR